MKTSTKLRYDSFVNVYLYNGFNATKAAIAAGYSSKAAKTKGSQLLAISNIKQQIEEKLAERQRLEEENRQKLDITVEEIRGKHRQLMELSQAAQDYSNATRNLEGLGKMIGVYKESAPLDDPAKQIDLARRTECQRLAAIRITEMLMEPGEKTSGIKQERQ